jgi:hypothetical protein
VPSIPELKDRHVRILGGMVSGKKKLKHWEKKLHPEPTCLTPISQKLCWA